MPKIQSDWWDQLQINFYQAPDGFIAIHSFKKPYGCKYFEVPDEWLQDDDFFIKVYERSIIERERRKVKLGMPCPICKRSIDFIFRYKGRFFCLNCGSHYEVIRGIIKITRSILDSE
jgi:hypothetical protein